MFYISMPRIGGKEERAKGNKKYIYIYLYVNNQIIKRPK